MIHIFTVTGNCDLKTLKKSNGQKGSKDGLWGDEESPALWSGVGALGTCPRCLCRGRADGQPAVMP